MESMNENVLKSLFIDELENCFEWMASLAENSRRFEADPMLKESLRIAASKVAQILRIE